MLHVYTQRSCVCTHRTPFAYKARRSCVYTYIDHRCTYRGLVYPQTTLQKNLPKKCIFTQNLIFCTQIDGTCTQILGTWVLSYTNSTTKKPKYTKKAHIHKNCSCVYNSELESVAFPHTIIRTKKSEKSTVEPHLLHVKLSLGACWALAGLIGSK